MQFKLMMGVGALLVSLGAVAQQPIPVMDGVLKGDPAHAMLEARRQLENILQCKPGTKIAPMDAQFAALRLVKSPDDVWVPARSGKGGPVFNDDVVGALVSVAAGEKKVTVYLRNRPVKPLAKELGVSKIDEQANTDEASYFKQTGKKSTLLVGAASEFSVGNFSVSYKSSVTCQLID